MDLAENTNKIEIILQEELLYKSIYKFLNHAENAGYRYSDLHTNKDKNEITLTFGDYKKNGEYYRIKLSNILYEDSENKKTVKSDISLEKLIGYNENDQSYNKIENLSDKSTVNTNPRRYTSIFINKYNLSKAENAPKIRNYDLNKVVLYSFAAAYGATVVSAVDNTPLVNNPYYGVLHLGMLIAPYIPLQFSKKIRSIPQMFSLALVSWVANSLAYYPIGMLMGHTAENLTDVINFYKFQIGLGSGNYVDKYGPLSLRINSQTKALSYALRLGLAVILSETDKILKEIKNGKGGKI
ncbi:MAG: hypothetical protein ACP5MV_03750 [Candidatus Parvarchaeum sp.]